MDSEDRLTQAADEARRSAASASIPDLAVRDKTVRVRRGIGMLTLAGAAVLAVVVPLQLLGDAPQVDVVDPFDESSTDDSAIPYNCIDPPLQLDGGLSRADAFTLLVPNGQCPSGYEGAEVSLSVPSTDISTLATLIVEGFSHQVELSAHRVDLSLRTVILDLDGSSLVNQRAIQGLAASLLQAVEYTAVQLVIDGECPAGTTCRYDRASVGLPEVDQPGALRRRAPTIPDAPDELASREPLPFCGYGDITSAEVDFVAECVSLNDEAGLPYEYMIAGESGRIFQVIRSDDGGFTHYVNLDEPGTGSPTGWWVQVCDADGCGELVALELIAAEPDSIGDVPLVDLLADPWALTAGSNGVAAWASAVPNEPYPQQGLLVAIDVDGRPVTFVATNAPFPLLEEVNGVVWMARGADDVDARNLVGRYDFVASRIEFWDIEDFTPTSISVFDEVLWMAQDVEGLPPEVALFVDGKIVGRWELEAGVQPAGINATSGTVWIIDSAGSRLLRFNQVDGVAFEMELPIAPTTMAFEEGSIWVGSSIHGGVLSIGPTLETVAYGSIPEPRAIVPQEDGAAIVFMGDGSAWRLADGDVEPILAGFNEDVLVDRPLVAIVGSEVWIVLADGTLTHRSIATGRENPAEAEGPPCNDPTIVDQLDAMLIVIGESGSWVVGESGSLARRLPRLPVGTVACLDYYLADLGGGDFADAVAFKQDGGLYVFMLPSPPPISQNGPEGAIDLSGETIVGAVVGDVFVGVYDLDEVILSYPYAAPQPGQHDVRGLLATGDGLDWLGEAWEGFPTDLEAVRLAYRWGVLAGQREDGTTWAFVDGQLFEFAAMSGAPAGYSTVLTDVGLGIDGEPVLVYLISSVGHSTVLRTVDLDTELASDSTFPVGLGEIAVAAVEDGYVIASSFEGCLEVHGYDRAGNRISAESYVFDCETQSLASPVLDVQDELLMISYFEVFPDAKSVAHLDALTQLDGDWAPSSLRFEPLVPIPASIDLDIPLVYLLMPGDRILVYDFETGPHLVEQIDLPVAATDFVVLP